MAQIHQAMRNINQVTNQNPSIAHAVRMILAIPF